MIDTQKQKLSENEVKQDKTNRIMNGVNVWASFYRANPHRFAHDYLGLTLKRFQQIILCMMFKFTNCIYLASRGGGKSFLLAVFCCCYGILFPESQICIASKTRGQASEILEKVRDILMPRSANLRLEIDEVVINQGKAYISFRNNSRIKVVTAADSARHNRATVLIIDEARMVDKSTIDTVLRKFLTSPRDPKYLQKAEYSSYPKERTKELYASSCWYESHWFYEQVRTYVVNMIRGRSYFCCAMPYQLPIMEGLLDRERIEDEMSESTFSSVSFRVEMESLFFGQGNGGLYSFDEINKNRVIKYPFYPKSHAIKLADKRLYAPPKIPGEIRILSADIALMSSEKNKNDATSIFINQMLPTSNGRYINNIVYTENHEGLRTDAQSLIIRKLFADYDCDYLVLDTKSVGLSIYDTLSADMYDSDTGVTYGALSCLNNEELAKRCLVPDAPKVVWSIQGTVEFNSQCALGLREALKQGNVRLLISEYDADEPLSYIRGYENLSPSDAVVVKAPYVHTSLLMYELVNLEYETKNNAIRVKEKSGMRKDRYSSLSYNIYVSKSIERDKLIEKAKKSTQELVFQYRAPRIKKQY